MLIYKIKNTINEKVYIGQTIKNAEERFKEHLKSAFYENSTMYNTKFYKDIRKFGKEKFFLEIIEDNIKNKKELDKKEKYYIKKFDSINEGYNTILGSNISHTKEIRNKISNSEKGNKNHMYGLRGGKNPASKPCRCITEDKIFMSVEEAAKYYNTSSINIRRTITKEREYCGLRTYGKRLKFEYIDKNTYNPYISHAKPKIKKVDRMKRIKNLYNEEIFNSIAEASRYYNISENDIRNKLSNLQYYLDINNNILLVKEEFFEYSKEDFFKYNFKIYNKTINRYYKNLPDAIKDIISNYDRKEMYEKYRGTFRRNKKLIINGNEIILNSNYKVNGIDE